jgi:hypothetical protein
MYLYNLFNALNRVIDALYYRRNNIKYVRFEVFTVVTMKNGVFWDVTTCGSCKNRHFGGTCRSVRRLLVTANVVPSSPIHVNVMMEALSSPKRWFLQEPHGVTSHKTPFFNTQYNGREKMEASLFPTNDNLKQLTSTISAVTCCKIYCGGTFKGNNF